MKNKRIDHISNYFKTSRSFNENFTIFFQTHEKIETCLISNFKNFGYDINETFTS